MYAIAGAPRTWRQAQLAAVLAVTEGAWASTSPAGAPHACAGGPAAALLRGLPEAVEPPVPHVAVADPAQIRLPGVVGHRLRGLVRSDIADVDGTPCLTAICAGLEHVTTLPGPVEATAYLEDLVSGGVARTGPHRRAAELWPGRRHVALVRDLTAPGAEAVFRSRLERDAVAALDRAGVPAPRVNAVVRDRAGTRIREVDLLWRETRLVVELDGLRFHSSAAQRGRDRATDRRLVTAGYRVLRYGWRDVQAAPGAMCAEIATALRMAA